MEKRTLLAVVLAIAVVMVWQSLFLPPPPPGEEATSPAVESVGSEDAVQVPTPRAPEVPSDSEAIVSEPPEPSDSELPREESIVESNGAIAVFTTEGGGIKSWKLTDYTTFEQSEGPLDVLKEIWSASPVLSRSSEPMDLIAGPFENALPFALSGY